MSTLALVFAAYLIGSTPFALIVSRAFGLADPRSYGSGNPGATNVLRTGNRLAALLTLLGDIGKGWVAVAMAAALAPPLGVAPENVAVAGFAAFFGHLHSAFLGFRGGKGVATAAGVLLGFDLWLGLASLAIWVAVAAAFRYSSAASIAAALAAPLLAGFILTDPAHTSAVLCMSILLVWRHLDNIRRLREGSEARIGETPPRDQEAGDKS
ncbi:MAG: glycerol-3-phosphate 1-O-acyltransferase PlsY [Rhodocyclaceae bacterium]